MVRKEHIRAFAEPEDSIAAKNALSLLELVSTATRWEDMILENCKTPILESHYDPEKLGDNEDIRVALEAVGQAKPFPPPKLPGSVIRQREIVEELENELQMSPISEVSGMNWMGWDGIGWDMMGWDRMG